MQSSSPNEIMGVLHTVSAILRSLNASPPINMFFNQIINPLNAMARNIYISTVGSIPGLLQAEQENDPPKMDLAVKLLLSKFLILIPNPLTPSSLELLQTWIETIENFIYKINDLRDQSLKNVLMNENLANVLAQILFLSVETPKQLRECIVSTTGLPEVDRRINSIKISVLQAYGKLLNFLFQAPAGVNYNLTQFFNLLHTFLPNVIVSLTKLCGNAQFDLETLLEVRLPLLFPSNPNKAE